MLKRSLVIALALSLIVTAAVARTHKPHKRTRVVCVTYWDEGTGRRYECQKEIR